MKKSMAPLYTLASCSFGYALAKVSPEATGWVPLIAASLCLFIVAAIAEYNSK